MSRTNQTEHVQVCRPARVQIRHFGRVVVAVLLVFLLACGFAATGYFYQQRSDALESACQELESIADLKVGQIVQWRHERKNDADMFLDPVLARHIQTDLARGDDAENHTGFRIMDMIQRQGQYDGILLFDDKLRVRYSSPALAAGDPSDPEALQLAARTLQTNQVLFSSLHRVKETGQVFWDMTTPLLVQASSRQVAKEMEPPAGGAVNRVGVVLFRMNASTFLVPELQRWPTLSPSAETFIIRREGNEVVYLSELRHRTNTAFLLRQSLSGTDSIASIAARGERGIVGGKDYRGVPVLAVVRSIPGRHWILIAKMDEDEIYAPLHVSFVSFSLVCLFLFLAACLAMGLIWRNREYYFAKKEVESERKIAEALWQSANRLHGFASATFEGICVSERGHIMDLNDQFLQMLGYERGELLGQPIEKYVASESQAVVKEAVRTDCEGPYESKLLRKDGARLDTEIRARMVDWQGRKVRIAAVRNITERLQLEAQFRQAQKMDTVGHLVSGVSHDFNNILTAILIHIELLKEGDGVNPGMKESLGELEEEALRGTGLIRQLLLFGRKKMARPEPVDLDQVVKGMAKILRRTLGANIELIEEDSGGAAWIKADRGMMEQVIMNLCVNARDAMVKGGRLVVGTSMAELADKVAQTNPQARAGRFVCLTVRDTGCGMDRRVLGRLFEPFFTTKEPGKGTGLGLATICGIVKQHEGWIDVESEVGQGSAFRVYFPVCTKVTETDSSSKGSKKLRGGSEKILLVEDDLPLRRIIALLLRRLGYAVLEAGTGEEALDIWKGHRSEIKLVVTDFELPGAMDGSELVEHVWREKNAPKVIISSGRFPETMKRPEPVNGYKITCLEKPYDAGKLAGVVRACLDQP